MESAELQRRNDEVIHELCAQAPSNEIRDCLRKYKQDTYRNQFAAINVCIKPVLIDTLNYLCCVKDWNSFKKPQCVHELICRIQSLLPEQCQFCSELYCVPKDQAPLLPCSKCGQEPHKECLLKALKLNADVEYTSQDISTIVNPTALKNVN